MIVGVLLCGGEASRFGGDKLLAGADPIAARAARALMAATPRSIAVIHLGKPGLRAALAHTGLEILETDRTARGMGSSLAAGVEAGAGASGWLVALGDMPSIQPETCRAVARALEGGARIAAPFDRSGRRGHPVGFAAALRAELLALDGDFGARDVLARHRDAIVPIVTDDPGIFVDIDTRADLERLGE